MEQNTEIVVVGGGAAGYAGAVALARSRRTVLLVDAGDPRNAPAAHVHNFLTRDGTPPAELYAAGRRELEGYGGHVISDRVTAIERDGDGFRVRIGGGAVTARGVLVATGARDELPDVPGLAEQWGRGVVHCPYCHGWEVRDKRIGVLATGPMAVHQALLFRQLSADVTLIVHTGEAPTGEDADKLAALGITVVAGPVAAVESADGLLTGVRLAGGEGLALDALVVASFVRARAELLAPLGIDTVELRAGEHAVATHVAAPPTGATSVPGLYVAGNVAEPMAQVIAVAAAGLMAGAALNGELISRDAAAAAQRHRDHHWGEQAWDERYLERPRLYSGAPNAALVTEITGLTPGTALDAGAGEGADAIWLARQGWTVIGHDLSDLSTSVPRHGLAVAGWSAEHVAATLGDEWQTDTCEARPRTVTNPHGDQVTIHDAVLRAHRIS